ncbi:MAG: ParB N-terminal domain-containing protein [Acidobacteria bacterium]|nr:ParB N-terminal domain-containing protein [Acidobacteriota bacterium]
MNKTKATNRQVERRTVDSLIVYERNARTHSEPQIRQIMASLREFGWTNPVLIDEKNNIIAGHARVEAAKRLEMAEVPCITLDGLTEAQKKAYLIADNKLALNAGWDDDLLRAELLDLKGLEFNLDLLGFNPEEMADLLLGQDVNQPEYDESAAADVKMVTCPECGHSFPK